MANVPKNLGKGVPSILSHGSFGADIWVNVHELVQRMWRVCPNDTLWDGYRALHLGKPLGQYATVNPNDHVNLCQSTNDAYPSAAKLAVVFKHKPLVRPPHCSV